MYKAIIEKVKNSAQLFFFEPRKYIPAAKV
jgi:hypothetical protein